MVLGGTVNDGTTDSARMARVQRTARGRLLDQQELTDPEFYETFIETVFLEAGGGTFHRAHGEPRDSSHRHGR